MKNLNMGQKIWYVDSYDNLCQSEVVEKENEQGYVKVHDLSINGQKGYGTRYVNTDDCYGTDKEALDAARKNQQNCSFC